MICPDCKGAAIPKEEQRILGIHDIYWCMRCRCTQEIPSYWLWFARYSLAQVGSIAQLWRYDSEWSKRAVQHRSAMQAAFRSE